MNAFLEENKLLLIGMAVALIGGYFLVKKGVPAALNAVNPLNNNNVINQAATAAYQDITGSTGTIGTDIYDVTHDGTLDPTSTNNILYRQGTSQDGSTIGTRLYDLVHSL
jgi:hypothetical protein